MNAEKIKDTKTTTVIAGDMDQSRQSLIDRRIALIARKKSIDAELESISKIMVTFQATRSGVVPGQLVDHHPGEGRAKAIRTFLKKHGPSTMKEIREGLPRRLTERVRKDGRQWVGGCPIQSTITGLINRKRVLKTFGPNRFSHKFSLIL